MVRCRNARILGVSATADLQDAASGRRMKLRAAAVGRCGGGICSGTAARSAGP
jgi:hypothetical protein